MKGSVYELVMVIIFIAIAGMIWAILGWSMENINEKMKTLIPDKIFNETPENDVANAMDWSNTAFFVFLFFISIVTIIWAVKRT